MKEKIVWVYIYIYAYKLRIQSHHYKRKLNYLIMGNQHLYNWVYEYLRLVSWVFE